MARSILPSKAPRSARHDLAAVKRHHRRSVRADPRALRREPDDDLGGALVDVMVADRDHPALGAVRKVLAEILDRREGA